MYLAYFDFQIYLEIGVTKTQAESLYRLRTSTETVVADEEDLQIFTLEEECTTQNKIFLSIHIV